MNARQIKALNWLDARIIRAIHMELLAEHGGLPGIRDHGLLESALARPKNVIAYGSPSIHQLAAAYGFGLARNHPFLDGNKRIALVAIALFLDINHHELTATQPDAVQTILMLAAGKLEESQLAAWIETNTKRSKP